MIIDGEYLLNTTTPKNPRILHHFRFLQSP